MRPKFFLYKYVYALIATLSDVYKNCKGSIGMFVVASKLAFLAAFIPFSFGDNLTVIFVAAMTGIVNYISSSIVQRVIYERC